MPEETITWTYTGIALHHSASPAHTTTVADIERWHIARKFRGVGYHYLVDHTGAVHRGRNLDTPGAHIKGHNSYLVGVCAIGNYDIETPTEALLLGLIDAFIEINERCGYGGGKLPMAMTYHKRLANTACPGKRLIDVFGKLEGLVLGAAVAGNVGAWAREQVEKMARGFRE